MYENIGLIKFKKIGVIKTPYMDDAPYQPVDEDKGEFCIIIDDKYVEGLAKLGKFRYIYVIYYLDRAREETPMIINPAWVDNEKVGLFASRSPERPNPIGLSVVRIKKITGNKIFTSGLDVFDNTPLLDIKPYVKDLDSKKDSNYGWIENLKGNMEHLLLHIKGIPH
jgi:tRNA-Thr(GGU) m(6)t(6)A37 methyltransferase TsaA